MKIQLTLALIALIALSSVFAEDATPSENTNSSSDNANSESDNSDMEEYANYAKCMEDIKNNPPCSKDDEVCLQPFKQSVTCLQSSNCFNDNASIQSLNECYEKCKGTDEKVVEYYNKLIACSHSTILTFASMIFGLLIILF